MEDFSSYIFSDFHPIDSPLESLRHFALYEITDRARRLIASRSYAEICYATNTVDYMLGCAHDLMRQEKNDKKKKSAPTPSDFTPTKILVNALLHFDIRKQKTFKKAQWHEYFAVLALTLVGDAIRYRSEKNDTQTPPHEIADYIWRCAYSAQEAITLAEVMAGQLTLTDSNKTIRKGTIRIRKRESAITGHTRSDRFKAEFIVLYHSRQWRSRSACADHYMADLKRDGHRMPWVRFNNKRVLLDALCAYGKGELAERIVKLVDDMCANQVIDASA